MMSENSDQFSSFVKQFCDFYVLGTKFGNFRDCKRELNLLIMEIIYFDLSTMGHRVSILTFILLELFLYFHENH